MTFFEKHGNKIITAIVIYIVAFFFYEKTLNQNFGLEKAAKIGDMYGAANAFFSGLAFIALIITLAIQFNQYLELKKESNNTKIENTFFNMLSVLDGIVARSFIKINSVDKYNGRECFGYAFNLLKQIVVNSPLFNEPYCEKASREDIIKTYENIYNQYHYCFGHYFRYVFNIIKFIKSEFNSDPISQQKYIDLLQAQLSNDEMAFIFYNSLSIHGKNSRGEFLFKKWLDEHNFFENIDKTCILDDSFLEDFQQTKFKFIINND